MEKEQIRQNLIRSTRQLKFINCSNAACNKMFLINSKEVEHGTGVYLCPTCLVKSKTHHTIECASCFTIIDYLVVEEGEEVSTYYSNKCTYCDGTIEDEIKLSNPNSWEIYTTC